MISEQSAAAATRVSPAAANQSEDVIGGYCSGEGCCQTYYLTDLISSSNHSAVSSFNPCSYLFLGEQERFIFRGASDLSDPNFMQRVRTTVPLVLDWVIGNLTCAQVQNSEDYACKANNSNCIDSPTPGWEGIDVAVKTGMKATRTWIQAAQVLMNVRTQINLNDCEKICINTPGSFYCSCPHGQYGDGRKNGKGCNAYNSHASFL